MQTIIFERVNHNKFGISRFKSNNIVSNWTWFLQRSDITLRNQWSNYSNWEYEGEQVYTLQPLYYSKLENRIIGILKSMIKIDILISNIEQGDKKGDTNDLHLFKNKTFIRSYE